MIKVALLLLFLVAGCGFATEPGPGYELVEQTKPDSQAEFFGGPHLDTVIEVYSRPDAEKFFGRAYKIILSSLADSSQKELLLEYEREAIASLSPNGKWIVVNDHPGVGYCEPRLFKKQTGVRFAEVKDADIWQRAIRFLSASNHYAPTLRNRLLSDDCIVESMLWSDDSSCLLLRIRREQTGEPVWISNWRCVYELTSGKMSTNLNMLNRGAISTGRYLVPAR